VPIDEDRKMTGRDAAQAEVRALAGEMVSALRLLSESSGSITKPAVRYAVTSADVLEL
jgi:hypothetical protein